MSKKVKVYGCYEHTYTDEHDGRRVYVDVVNKLYDYSVRIEDIELEIEDISDEGRRNIQSQRSLEEYATRLIRIYENNKLTHIVGISNTNFDYDKHFEYQAGLSRKNKDTFGENNYHANTYLVQGMNNIMDFYFENRNDGVDLSFYLLDTNKSYTSNATNILYYRILATLGFSILNIDEINFEEYNRRCNCQVSCNSLPFSSMNTLLNHMTAISAKNSGNIPGYMQCSEEEQIDEDGNSSGYNVDRYTYYFKALSAQAYDSMLKILCMKKLAGDIDIEFRLLKQYYGYSNDEIKISDSIANSVINTLRNFDIELVYVTEEEFINNQTREDTAYQNQRRKNDPRNQQLFRNNMRRKAMQCKCVLCGEENPDILDAAHLWEIQRIKRIESGEQLQEVFDEYDGIEELIDNNSPNSADLFFKKYCIANSGENGVWMCKNHHYLFDKENFCFNGDTGEVISLFANEEYRRLFFAKIINEDRCAIDSCILTPSTKSLLKIRRSYLVSE